MSVRVSPAGCWTQEAHTSPFSTPSTSGREATAPFAFASPHRSEISALLAVSRAGSGGSKPLSNLVGWEQCNKQSYHQHPHHRVNLLAPAQSYTSSAMSDETQDRSAQFYPNYSVPPPVTTPLAFDVCCSSMLQDGQALWKKR